MKTNRNGQAKILDEGELTALFKEGFALERDRAIFSTCLFTGCRISEALQLELGDIGDEILTFRRETTKGKLASRSISINPTLKAHIDSYLKFSPPSAKQKYLFPGGRPGTHLSSKMADAIFREACKRCGIKGASTHSLRRTALTQMSNQGIPLRVIQSISGHSSLASLQRYLEVTPDQQRLAIEVITIKKPSSVDEGREGED